MAKNGLSLLASMNLQVSEARRSGRCSPVRAVLDARISVWREVLFPEPWAAMFPATDIDVVALLRGPEFFGWPEVPLAREEGGIAIFL